MEQENIIKKWLSDDLSPEENDAFMESEEATLNEAIVTVAKRFKAPSTSGMPSFEEFEQKRLNKTSVKKDTGSILRWVSGIAAVLVVSIGIYNWSSDTATTVQTAIAQTENVALPDTSLVELNAASKITFDPSSWEAERLVKLEGEAFFDVAKGKRFDVETPAGIISVLGTEFNVRQRENVLEVTCYEGKVKVASGNLSKIITAGEQITIRNGKILQSTTTQKYPVWKDNISYFQSTPLAEVTAELERHFEINVNFVDVDTTVLFSGGFEHTTIETALKSITQPLNIKYEVKDDGNVIILNAQ